jgi:hypothetical protein
VDHQLPVHFVKDPLSFTESSNQVDLDTAKGCLRLYLCRTDQLARSKDELRTQLVASQAGTRALSWYLNSGNHEDVAPMHFRFLDGVIFSIVAEGSTSFLWDMFMLSDPYKRMSRADVEKIGTRDLMSPHSKGFLFVPFIEAQAFWSTGPNMMNEPLQSFHTAQLDPVLGSVINGSYQWLVKNLTIADKSSINIRNYERFVRNIPNYRATSPDFFKDLDMGVFELMHPTHPDPRKLLRIFHDAVWDSQTMQKLERISRQRLERVSRGLMHHCRHAGEMTEARFVADSVEAILRRKRSSTTTSRPGELHERSHPEDD